MVTPQSPNPTTFPKKRSSRTPPEPRPLTPQDLVPHLRSLARSLRDRPAAHEESAP